MEEVKSKTSVNSSQPTNPSRMNAVGFGANGLVGGSLAAVLQGLGAAGKGALVDGVVMAATGVGSHWHCGQGRHGLAREQPVGQPSGPLGGGRARLRVVRALVREGEARAAFNAGTFAASSSTRRRVQAREVGHEGKKAPWVDDAIRTCSASSTSSGAVGVASEEKDERLWCVSTPRILHEWSAKSGKQKSEGARAQARGLPTMQRVCIQCSVCDRNLGGAAHPPQLPALLLKEGFTFERFETCSCVYVRD